MKKIPLNHGKFALVDDEDFERVAQLRWTYFKDEGNEYARTNIYVGEKRVQIQMHRFILPHEFPQTDHRDGNGLNNQKNNLRPCSRVQNGANRKVQYHSSKFKGVSSSNGKWRSSIVVNNKTINLGSFTNETEAAKAYDESAEFHWGEFARTNRMMGLLP